MHMLGDMRLGPVARGLLTYVPPINDLLPSVAAGGATNSASYCYGVWLKHVTLLHAHGMPAVPPVIAELGPGDSLGVGLCALLSGADNYVGLDVVAHSSSESNQTILADLVKRFRERAANTDHGWPHFDSWLDARGFPGDILTEETLARALRPERIDAIRRAVTLPMERDPVTVEYKAPWFDPHVIETDSVDLIVSQSVLEHVDDLAGTYRALYQWLKPGGWMSHQIDFKSHQLSKRWNGYRTCSEGMWTLTVGRRPFLINRQPASVHLRLLQEAGFTLVTQQKYLRDDGVRRTELAPLWSGLSDEDLNCSGLYVIARK
jgi:SAM-dependent methyltransferase